MVTLFQSEGQIISKLKLNSGELEALYTYQGHNLPPLIGIGLMYLPKYGQDKLSQIQLICNAKKNPHYGYKQE